jgi:hypothetical protein
VEREIQKIFRCFVEEKAQELHEEKAQELHEE